MASKHGDDNLEGASWKRGNDSDVELKELSRNGSQDMVIGDGSKAETTKVPALEINVTQMYALAQNKNRDTIRSETRVETEESESTMPFRTEQWGLNTEISAGNQQEAAKKNSKVAKMLGFSKNQFND